MELRKKIATECAQNNILVIELKKEERSLEDAFIKLIENRVTKSDCENGYILDGFPRTKVQAEKYDELLNNYRRFVTLITWKNMSEI